MKKKERTLCAGTMTEAQFKSKIISALRNASRWWKPKQDAIKRAKVSRGLYKCELCWKIVPLSKAKKTQIVADHIEPIIDPAIWFVSYDEWIRRCFIEEEGYQAICLECHTKKTNNEKAIAKERKNNNINKDIW